MSEMVDNIVDSRIYQYQNNMSEIYDSNGHL